MSITSAHRARGAPAEVFPPGDFIREELEARHWTQGDLAAVLGRPVSAVNEIINGKKRITAETAKAIGAAFGTSAQVWMNLENTYRLAKAGPPDPAIARRAKQLEAAR
jgi:HTH-type transcriptional regulator/antitoxin HigA